MMFWRSLIRSLLPGKQSPITEASEQRHNKSAKIQTGLEATMMNSLYQLDKDERATAAAYRNWKVFGQKTIPKTGGNDDEMLIADNIYNIKPPSLLGTLLGLSAFTGVGGAAAYFLLPLIGELMSGAPVPDSPPPQVIQQSDVYDYDVESRVIPPE